MDGLLAVLARQLGVITRSQALEVGISPRTIARRLQEGTWVRVQPRVFRSVHFPESREQAPLAAVLAAGPSAAASHRAAAWVWGIQGLRSAPLEITVPAGHVPVLADAIVHPIPDLTPIHVGRVGPLPVTTVARTLVDLGAVSRPW